MKTGSSICEGFTFIEGPRWYEGALWFSDFYDEAVFRVVPESRQTKLSPLHNSPRDWDGCLTVIFSFRLCWTRPSTDGPTQGLNKYADLSAIAERRINDMLVDPSGRAWVVISVLFTKMANPSHQAP